MHNYILLDILEEKEINKIGVIEVTGMIYLIGCENCNKSRIVEETTFERMLSLGVVKLP